MFSLSLSLTGHPLPAGQHLYGIHPSVQPHIEPANETSTPVVPVDDRVKNLEATLLGFIAENSMSLSQAPRLVDLVKSLANDKTALQRLSMDRTTASYKLKHGLSYTLRQRLIESLKKTNFSLNIDEATSKTNKKVLAILVSHFDEQQRKVVVHHLDALSLTSTKAADIVSKISDVMNTAGLPWENLISVLMDSCSVMRGAKSGVEVQLRKLAPNLLDIDGDTCHHAHIAAQNFCKPFGGHIETLLRHLHTEFKWSLELKEKFFEICTVLGIKPTTPARYVPHRWLSILDVSVDTIRLYDAYWVYFFSFVRPSDKDVYDEVLVDILNKANVTDEGKNTVKMIQEHLRSKWKSFTEDGKNRKSSCMQKIVQETDKTQLLLYLYSSVLPLLKEYVLFFQSKDLKIHRLHDKQESLLNNFFSCFMKSEELGGGARQLSQLDLTDRDKQLPLKELFTGSQVQQLMKKMSKSERNETSTVILNAYISCGKTLQTKMPLSNKLLMCLSAVDPVMLGTSEGRKLMSGLKPFCSFLSEDERNSLDLEVRGYHADSKLRELPRDISIDSWWGAIDCNTYPVLTKTMKSLLSCFHGPLVESSFSLMGDILDIHSCNTDIETYAAYQNVKFHLAAANKSSVEFFGKEDPQTCQIDKDLSSNMKEAWRRNKKRQLVTRKDVPLTTAKIHANKKILQSTSEERSPHQTTSSTDSHEIQPDVETLVIEGSPTQGSSKRTIAEADCSTANSTPKRKKADTGKKKQQSVLSFFFKS